MYFDDRILLMSRHPNETNCRRFCVWTDVSVTNSASIIFATASLPGVQRWRTVTEVGIFGNAARFDVTIFAAILTDTFCSRPCKWIQRWL